MTTWHDEGVAFRAFQGAAVIDGVTAKPLYRIFNPVIRVHLWTTLEQEYSLLPNRGWRAEGVVCYIFDSQVTGTVPLFRVFHPGVKRFFLTADANEYDRLGTIGFNKEGIIGYVLPPEEVNSED